MGSCISYENPLDFIRHIKNSYRIRNVSIIVGFVIEFIIILLYRIIGIIYLLIITVVIFFLLMVVNWFADLPISKGLVGLQQRSGEDIILEIIYEVPKNIMDEISKHYGEDNSTIDLTKVVLHKIIFPGKNIELSIRGGPNHYFLRIIKHGNILANKQCKLNGKWLSMTINIDWEIKDIIQLFNELKQDLTFQQELKSSTILDQEIIPWKYFETFVANYLQEGIIPLLRTGIDSILTTYDSSNGSNMGRITTEKSLGDKIRKEVSDYLSKFVIYDNWLATDGVEIGEFYLGPMLESTTPNSEDIVIAESISPVPGLVLTSSHSYDSKDQSLLIIQRSPRDKTTIYFTDTQSSNHVNSTTELGSSSTHSNLNLSVSNSGASGLQSKPLSNSAISITGSSINRDLILIDPADGGTMDL